MNDAPLLIIAAGGTGGHMFPAQALAEEMLRRGWRVKLSTDERGNAYSSGFPDGIEREVLSSASPSQGSIVNRLISPFKILFGACGAILKMRKDRPAAVVGFGGYPALPAMIAARVLRLPRMIHEQNGVLGRVNKLFARQVSVVACAVWPTQTPPKTQTVHTGNPVRNAILAHAREDYQPPGQWPMQILVIGGSQGARALSHLVPEAIAALPDGLRKYLTVFHQARDEDFETAKASYEKAGVAAEVRPFFENVAERIAASQLVISRAGASSIADISVIGRPSLLIPYPSATNDHQTANAQGLSDSGGAFVLQEASLTSTQLSEHITAILSDADGAIAMAQAAAAQGKPNATAELANLVETLAKKG